MHRKLPSLLALRAFEAASRIGNFTKAAEELLLTQSAVSRHIRNLEADLGTTLFRREGKHVTLTDDGLHLRGVVGRAFDTLSDGIEVLRRDKNRQRLSISLLPSLAAKWLVPAIASFISQHPDIDLNIHCSRALVDFDRDGIDLAIRYGRGNWPGCNAELLMHEEIVVVCAPAIREQMGSQPQPEVLEHLPLLYGDDPDTWHGWLRASGLPKLDLPKGPIFTDANALLDAAVSGQGVMLGRSVLVAGSLSAGALVEPFGIRAPASFDYYVVTPKNKPDSEPLRELRNFLRVVAET